MERPSRARLLELYEQGRALHPLDRALLLLGAAFPDAPPERLADLTIGERDAALLALRQAIFGPRLPGHVDCPRCGARLEFVLDVEALRLQAPTAEPSWRTVRVSSGEHFRVPTSRDLARLADGLPGQTAEHDTARQLARLCYVTDVRDGAPIADPTVRHEPADELLAELEERLAEVDPQADVELDFACEQCGGVWRTPFDVGALLWEEVEAHAVRLLADVHVLARAYGWPEREVLALSDARRAAYLELAGG